MSEKKPPKYFIWKEQESQNKNIVTDGFLVRDDKELDIQVADLTGRDPAFKEGGTELPRFIVYDLVPRSRAVDHFLKWMKEHLREDDGLLVQLSDVFIEHVASNGVEAQIQKASGVFQLAGDELRSRFAYYVAAILAALRVYKDDGSKLLATMPVINRMHAVMTSEADKLVADASKRRKKREKGRA